MVGLMHVASRSMNFIASGKKFWFAALNWYKGSRWNRSTKSASFSPGMTGHDSWPCPAADHSHFGFRRHQSWLSSLTIVTFLNLECLKTTLSSEKGTLFVLAIASGQFPRQCWHRSQARYQKDLGGRMINFTDHKFPRKYITTKLEGWTVCSAHLSPCSSPRLGFRFWISQQRKMHDRFIVIFSILAIFGSSRIVPNSPSDREL